MRDIVDGRNRCLRLLKRLHHLIKGMQSNPTTDSIIQHISMLRAASTAFKPGFFDIFGMPYKMHDTFSNTLRAGRNRYPEVVRGAIGITRSIIARAVAG